MDYLQDWVDWYHAGEFGVSEQHSNLESAYSYAMDYYSNVVGVSDWWKRKVLESIPLVHDHVKNEYPDQYFLLTQNEVLYERERTESFWKKLATKLAEYTELDALNPDIKPAELELEKQLTEIAGGHADVAHMLANPETVTEKKGFGDIWDNIPSWMKWTAGATLALLVFRK
jgi:hypothetical protein